MKRFFGFLKVFYKEVMLPASFLFTLYVFIVYGIAMLINNLINGVAVHPIVLALGYAYALIICSSSKIFRSYLSMPLKVLISYSSYVLPIFLILFVANKKRGEVDASPLSPPTIITIIVVTSVLYALIAIPIFLIKRRRRRKAEAKEEYQSQFNEI